MGAHVLAREVHLARATERKGNEGGGKFADCLVSIGKWREATVGMHP